MKNNTCEVDEGFYVTPEGPKPCHFTCKTCIENKNNCTSCKENFTFDEKLNKCVIDDGFTVDPTDPENPSKKCHDTCKTC